MVENNLRLEKNQARQKKKDVLKALGILVFLVLIFFMVGSLYQNVLIMHEKLSILDKVQREVDELRMHNLDLILKQTEVVSYDYIEKAARDKLGYSDDDEILFIIPDELLESDEVEKELTIAKGEDLDDDYYKPEEIFEEWVDFLFFEGV